MSLILQALWLPKQKKPTLFQHRVGFGRVGKEGISVILLARSTDPSHPRRHTKNNKHTTLPEQSCVTYQCEKRLCSSNSPNNTHL